MSTTSTTSHEGNGAASSGRAAAEPFDAAGASAAISTTVIEASAGTGKTTTIAALTVRALAQGWCTVDEVMLVTFGRRASSELRNRVYRRLAATIDALEAAERGATLRPLIDDGVHRQLVTEASPDERRQHLERLRAAHAGFDRATIATTHQFCHTMLSELGVLADFDRGAGFVDDPSELIEQVTNDVQLRMFAPGDQPPLRARTAAELARLAVERPVPLVASDSPQAQLQLRFAEQVRTELEIALWQGRRYGFDDMVRRLHRALAAQLDEIDREQLDPDAAQARRILSRRFRLVMIDEYQDTDSLQWQIVRAAFHGHSRVFLIGDPKQAIYAFRGADVAAYLVARHSADHTTTLVGNRRSAPALIEPLNALLQGQGLGEGGIVVPPAVATRAPSRVDDTAGHPLPAVALRTVLPREGDTWAAGQLERRVDADVVAEVLRLLDGCVLHDEADPGGPDHERPLAASDIHILVRTNRRGERLRRQLARAGVPAVFAGAESVLGSPAAGDFVALFEAIVEQSTRAVRRACLTDLVGLDVPALAATDEGRLADLAVTIRGAGRTLERAGVAAMMDELAEQTDLVARLLARPGGERRLTDLHHVAELLHAEAERHGVVPGGGTELSLTAHLLRWLVEAGRQASSGNDERTRRLESDASAVQIMTIHRAKGLSLPVVLLPDAATWWSRPGKAGQPVVLHEPDGRQVLSVLGTAAQHDQAHGEDADEQLRLFYVAATRARHLLRMWWGPSKDTDGGPLHRLLFSTPDSDRTPARTIPSSADQLAELHRRWDQHFAVQVVDRGQQPPRPEPPRPVDPSLLDARRFTRRIDTRWVRTSYSALTADTHVMADRGPLLDDEPEPTDDQDPAVVEPAPGGSDGQGSGDLPAGLASPLGDLPGGVTFGTLVHSILEQLDWTVADPAPQLDELIARTMVDTPVADVPADRLAQGLGWVIDTELGAITGGRSLAQVPLADRLAELDFELPLAAVSADSATVADLAATFSDRSLVPADDPLAGYGERLAASVAADRHLAGWLTGSIDAVLRWTDDDGHPRHTVVDYKTNRVPVPEGRPLTVADYGLDTMAEAMMDAHYPLQALIYSAALHRFLGQRLPGYDPRLHLGGVGYLFVRGMAPAERRSQAGLVADERGTVPGVFAWHPSPALVERASRILGGDR